MENSHTIIYEGIELEIFGDYEDYEEETGFKGGWSTHLIKCNEIDIYDMLNESTLIKINEIIVDNYY